MDLCFVKDVIGLCASTSTYGCYHCSLKRDDWSTKIKKLGKERNISDISTNGCNVLNRLGGNPDRTSKKFKEVQLENHGHYTFFLLLYKMKYILLSVYNIMNTLF